MENQGKTGIRRIGQGRGTRFLEFLKSRKKIAKNMQLLAIGDKRVTYAIQKIKLGSWIQKGEDEQEYRHWMAYDLFHESIVHTSDETIGIDDETGQPRKYFRFIPCPVEGLEMLMNSLNGLNEENTE